MVLADEKRKKFEELCAPVMDWLANEFASNVYITIASRGAKMSEDFAIKVRERNEETVTHVVTEDKSGRRI